MLTTSEVAKLTDTVNTIVDLISFEKKMDTTAQRCVQGPFVRRHRSKEEVEYMLRLLDVALDEIIESLDDKPPKKQVSEVSVNVFAPSGIPQDVLADVKKLLELGVIKLPNAK